MIKRSLGAMRAELRDCIEELSVFGILHQCANVAREEAQRAVQSEERERWQVRAAWFARLAERCTDADLCPHAAENQIGG